MSQSTFLIDNACHIFETIYCFITGIKRFIRKQFKIFTKVVVKQNSKSIYRSNGDVKLFKVLVG